MDPDHPQPPTAAATGSEAERAAFLALQARLPGLFREVFRDPGAPRTVVVVPGLSLDAEVLAKVAGARHYEERLLSMLMLLRLPRTRIVYVTSVPIAPVVVDYYLSLLSGVPADHARRRLVLLSAHDAGPGSLTSKLLARPRLLARIRMELGDPDSAHLSVFNATADEVSLAVRLGIPMYACDPVHGRWGGKSGSREAFRRAGIELAAGAEDLADLDAAAEAAAGLFARDAGLRRVVFKLNEGFSGDGNAVLDRKDVVDPTRAASVLEALPAALRMEAEDLPLARYGELFRRHGGIVEAWLEGEGKRSPSVQVRINPLGGLELISSHDQVLAGRSGQVFQGSTFPADPAYAVAIQERALAVAAVLRDEGVLGRFAVDFVSVPDGDGWRHRAIEINLRKGGTTLPFQMLQFLTNGVYDAASATFLTPLGQPRHYYATDNLVHPRYRRLVPEDLIDILVCNRLQFDETRLEGVVFNLIGAMSEFGKLGLVCIADRPARAMALYRQAVEVLDREAGADDARPCA